MWNQETHICLTLIPHWQLSLFEILPAHVGIAHQSNCFFDFSIDRIDRICHYTFNWAFNFSLSVSDTLLIFSTGENYSNRKIFMTFIRNTNHQNHQIIHRNIISEIHLDLRSLQEPIDNRLRTHVDVQLVWWRFS